MPWPVRLFAAEILKEELGAASPGDLAHVIQKKLDRVKQVACIAKQASLNGGAKRFSRALRSTIPPDKAVDNTHTFYHAHPQQAKHCSSKMPAGGNGRGRKAGWDTSFAQVPSDDYVRNVRNCKMLQRPPDSMPRSAVRSHSKHSQSSSQPPKQVGSSRRVDREVRDMQVGHLIQDHTPAPKVIPSAAAVLRQLKQEQRCQRALQQGDAMSGMGIARCSNSQKHSAVCESHTLGSHAAQERVKRQHRKSEGHGSHSTQPGTRAAANLEKGVHPWCSLFSMVSMHEGTFSLAHGVAAAHSWHNLGSCAGKKSATGNGARNPRVVLPKSQNLSPPPRLRKVKRAPAAIESSLRLIEDSRDDGDWAASYTASTSAVQHGRPSTPRLVAADKPRLKAASCTSAAESAQSPAATLTGRRDGVLSGNVLDGPFYMDSTIEAPHSVDVSQKAQAVASNQTVVSPCARTRTASSSSSHSQDLNSSFRQFMVDKLHAAHALGKPVDSADPAPKKNKPKQKSEQNMAKIAAQQLLAGVHPTDVCNTESVSNSQVQGDGGLEMGQQLDGDTGGEPSAADLDSPGGSRGRARHSSLESQQWNKSAETRDGMVSPGDVPGEAAIGVALISVATASATGRAAQFDTASASGSGAGGQLMLKTGCQPGHVKEGVLHTFVADRLVVEGAGMSEARLTGLDAPMDTSSGILKVQQHQEKEVDAATIGTVGMKR